MVDKKENPRWQPGTSESSWNSATHGKDVNTGQTVALVALVKPEASPSGKAQVVLYVQPGGCQTPFVQAAPVTAVMSAAALRRWCYSRGCFLSIKEATRDFKIVEHFYVSAGWFASAEQVETFLALANAKLAGVCDD